VRELHEEIHVAFFAGLSSGDGAKQRDRADAVLVQKHSLRSDFFQYFLACWLAQGSPVTNHAMPVVRNHAPARMTSPGRPGTLPGRLHGTDVDLFSRRGRDGFGHGQLFKAPVRKFFTEGRRLRPSNFLDSARLTTGVLA